MKALAAVVFSLCFGCITSDYSVSLEEVSTVFVPTGNRVWDESVAETASYDHERKLLYVVGGRSRTVLSYENTISPTVVTEIVSSGPSKEFRDITACRDYFILTTQDEDNPTLGVIEIFRWQNVSTDPELLYSEEVLGPDLVNFLPGCKEAVVTVRGQAYSDNGQFRDPKAKVIFITLPDPGYSGTFQDNVELVTLDFTNFDSRINKLQEDGVRFVYSGNGNNFSNDIDPEGLVVSPDGKKVYISLQVTNAVAVVDVPTKTITHVHGLGMKDWSNLTMDASDKDGGINMKKWPIFSYYQPDGIGYLNHDGQNYVVTANEGYYIDYSDITTEDGLLSPNVSAETRNWLSEDEKLGRLTFTRVNGENTTTSYSKFVAFGSRSFSIWDASTMDQMYDSGDELARRIAESNPDLFNSGLEADNTPREDSDEVSDRKGAEIESIAIGAIDGLSLIFVGAERSNMVFIYSVLDDITSPKFESMWNGVSNTSATWKSMFDAKTMKGIDPEYLSFLDAQKSPTGKPALLMMGALSNSVTLFNIKLTGTVPKPMSTTSPTGSADDIVVNMLLMTASLFHLYFKY